ncbi:hypothetical protein FQN54_004431 [Arachnomyces sp. PD_36]|nr:hypothetical protein FQN54_004431 [Arachnomyces sp. PD_36]
MSQSTGIERMLADTRLSLQRSEEIFKSLAGSGSSRIPRLTSPGKMEVAPRIVSDGHGLKQGNDPITANAHGDSTISMASTSSHLTKGAKDPPSSRSFLNGTRNSPTTPSAPDPSVVSDSGNESELVKTFQETCISNVDAWLDTVLDGPETGVRAAKSPLIFDVNPITRWDADKEKNFNYNIFETESNKENVKPSCCSSWETTSSECGGEVTKGCYVGRRSHSEHSSHQSNGSGGKHPPQLSTPILLRKTQPRQNPTTPQAGVHNYLVPDRPSGFFSLPPRRKKMKSSMTPMPTRADTAYDTSQQFEIAEDEDAELGLPELSPYVMKYRKGKEPKRVRCASYFDTDLFSNTERNGKEPAEREDGRIVLGEIAHSSSGTSGDADVSGDGGMDMCDDASEGAEV